MRNRTIVSIHAHPDDTEIFCAGTLIQLKKLGFDVAVVTMTDGRLGGVNMPPDDTGELRRVEAAKAAESIGATYHCLDQPDGFLFDSSEIRKKTVSLLRSLNAEVIITHRIDDYHPDHRATAQIVENAAIISSLENVPVDEEPLASIPLLYRSNTIRSTSHMGSTLLNPHFVVNISSVMDEKMAMLSCHQSQVALMRDMQGMNDFYGEIKKQSAFWGIRAGVDFAEGFWQHRGGGFPTRPLLQEVLGDQIISCGEQYNK